VVIIEGPDLVRSLQVACEMNIAPDNEHPRRFYHQLFAGALGGEDGDGEELRDAGCDYGGCVHYCCYLAGLWQADADLERQIEL